MTCAVYPGTFDPFTRGHLDLVERALRLFPRVIVAIADNPQKAPLFTVEERTAIIREATRHLAGVEIDAFHTLLVHYARERGALVVLRDETTPAPVHAAPAMGLLLVTKG